MDHRIHAFAVSVLLLTNAVSAAVGTVIFKPADVQRMVHRQDARIALTLPMPSGVEMQLSLERMHVVNHTSRLTVMTADGPVHSPLVLSVATYRAKLPDGGFAVFTFDTSGAVTGMVSNNDGRFTLTRQRSNNDPSAYTFVRDDMRPFTCGTTSESISEDLKRLVSETQLSAKANRDLNQSTDTLEMKLAVEVDFKLRTKLGSVNLATSYVTELVALLSTIYESELAIRFVLGNVRVWDNAGDPYPDAVSIFNGLLDLFVDEYRTKMTSVDRDMALLLVSRNGLGGIARTIGGVCSEDGSYCAGDVRADLNGGLSKYVVDIYMMAHEIGHVCGGLHTQSCMWPSGPLDSCVASEDGECVGWNMRRPARGTIMSYCHQQLYNGGTLVYEFHPLSRNVIRAYTRSAPCLTTDAPLLTNRVYGVVTDAKTGAPIAGLQLTLGRYYDKVVPLVPNIGTDTVTTTAADGSYSFSGVGFGMYYIAMADDWVPYPLKFDGLFFTNSIMVADTATRKDVSATRGQRVEFVVTSRNKNGTHVLSFYSEEIASLLRSVNSDHVIVRKNDSTLHFISFLTNGRYVIVPTAEYTSFSPSKVILDITGGSGSRTVNFTASYDPNKNISAISLGIGGRPASPTSIRPHFISGIPYELRNIELNKIVGSGVVPDDGVIVVDSVLTAYSYRFELVLDTASNAPYRGQMEVYPNEGMRSGIYIEQERRRPLIARAYTMSVRQSTYTPLVSPTVLYNNKEIGGDGPSLIDIPFPLRILDRDFAQLYVSHFGYLTFGDVATDPYSETPFYAGVETPLSVSALGTWIDYGSDTTLNRHIAWAVEGAAPNRTLAFEWKNGHTLAYDDDGNEIFVGPLSFQIRISESGVIDMVYDTPDSVQYPFAAWVGLRGNDVLDNNVVTSAGSMQSATAGFVYPEFPRMTINTPADVPSGLTYHWELGATSVAHDETNAPVSIHYNAAQTTLVVNGITERSTAMIVDLLGNIVLTTHLEPGTLTTSGQAWNVSSLASGRYTIVITGEPHTVIESFVVVR